MESSSSSLPPVADEVPREECGDVNRGSIGHHRTRCELPAPGIYTPKTPPMFRVFFPTRGWIPSLLQDVRHGLTPSDLQWTEYEWSQYGRADFFRHLNSNLFEAKGFNIPIYPMYPLVIKLGNGISTILFEHFPNMFIIIPAVRTPDGIPWYTNCQ